MGKDDILKVIVDELGGLTTNSEIDLDAPDIVERKFEDLMLDSLEILEFALDLEEKLDIELEISEFPQDATVGEFVDYLLALVK